MTFTDADFDQLSWHDCHIWGFELRAGDPDLGDWTSDFALDIDFIVAWMCAPSGSKAAFRVAPATLIFHGVTSPRINLDWAVSGAQTALHPVSIDAIERELVRDQKVYLDRPYYRWRIIANWPAPGEIVLGAVGFTQELRAEPVLSETQCLSRHARRAML